MAFPKVATSAELMSGAPAAVDADQLRDLSIALVEN
jgi:aspartyl-tRNA synthetase